MKAKNSAFCEKVQLVLSKFNSRGLGPCSGALQIRRGNDTNRMLFYVLAFRFHDSSQKQMDWNLNTEVANEAG